MVVRETVITRYCGWNLFIGSVDDGLPNKRPGRYDFGVAGSCFLLSLYTRPLD